jgi:hypothetical protein
VEGIPEHIDYGGLPPLQQPLYWHYIGDLNKYSTNNLNFIRHIRTLGYMQSSHSKLHPKDIGFIVLSMEF